MWCRIGCSSNNTFFFRRTNQPPSVKMETTWMPNSSGAKWETPFVTSRKNCWRTIQMHQITRKACQLSAVENSVNLSLRDYLPLSTLLSHSVWLVSLFFFRLKCRSTNASQRIAFLVTTHPVRVFSPVMGNVLSDMWRTMDEKCAELEPELHVEPALKNQTTVRMVLQ